LVGASGAISGVIAYYAVVFPDAVLGTYLRILRIPVKWFAFTAVTGFIVWLVIQVFLAILQNSKMTYISAGAHLGGAFAGLVAGIVVRIRRAEPGS